MPRYEFECKQCGKTQDLFFGMREEKIPPVCCGRNSERAYSLFHTQADLLYHGTSIALGPNPVEIHSKRQWKRELKKRGMTDDFDNVMSCEKPFKKSIKESRPERRKMIENAYREAKRKVTGG